MIRVALITLAFIAGCELPPTDEQACEKADGEWICEGRYCRCEVYEPSGKDEQ